RGAGVVPARRRGRAARPGARTRARRGGGDHSRRPARAGRADETGRACGGAARQRAGDRRRGARLGAGSVVAPVLGPVLHPQTLRRGRGRVQRAARGWRGERRAASRDGGGRASPAGRHRRGSGWRATGGVNRTRVVQWLWSGAPLARVARLPLVPLAALYWGATRVRAAAYRAGWRRVARLPFPTVAVGNLSVGGTGKTPLAAWIARYYAQRGRRPAILLRGYGGDEPMVQRRLATEAVIVAVRDRCGITRSSQQRGADLAVLDDAYQLLGVARDLNIAVVSAESVGLSVWPLPAGPWREGPAALERADVIIVTRKRVALDAAAAFAAWLARGRRDTPVWVAHRARHPLEGLRAGAAGGPGGLVAQP